MLLNHHGIPACSTSTTVGSRYVADLVRGRVQVGERPVQQVVLQTVETCGDGQLQGLARVEQDVIAEDLATLLEAIRGEEGTRAQHHLNTLCQEDGRGRKVHLLLRGRSRHPGPSQQQHSRRRGQGQGRQDRQAEEGVSRARHDAVLNLQHFVS